MAWGETGAWLDGTENMALYQDLLDDAAARPARDAQRKKVVHPEEDKASALLADVQSGICFAATESKLVQEFYKSLVPLPGCLLQTVQRLLELPHIVGSIVEEWWLLNVDLFLQFPI